MRLLDSSTAQSVTGLWVDLDRWEGPLQSSPTSIDTYTGLIVDLFDPDPSAICVEDIAHALSLQCRFSGHVRFHYSVAQHLVLVSQLCPRELKLAGLMHDASEAYLNDITSPLKRHVSFEIYKRLEHRMMGVIAQVFGFEWPKPEWVEKVDLALRWWEAVQLMHPRCSLRRKQPDVSGLGAPPAIEELTSRQAEEMFLAAFNRQRR
jgi:hypothetical protein